MLEIMVFAITLVVAQVFASLVLIKLFMSEYFIKKYYKWMMKMIKDLEKMEYDFLDEESN